MKLVFLDFDGVMNTDSSVKETDLERSLVAKINRLISNSGATVIVSSSWRIYYSIEELNYFLKHHGATFDVSDVTPILHRTKMSLPVYRGDEIQKYLDSLSKQPEAFVILDDLNDMLHLKKYLVRTNSKIGITDNNVEKALQILNE